MPEETARVGPRPTGPSPAELARPLVTEDDLDPLLDRVGDARVVLLGEASHGTHEYYAGRAALTRRLVTERGFSFVAVEGDWPDCYRVTCAVTGASGEEPRQALEAFARWPTWMWANEEVADLTGWLAGHNAGRAEDDRVGFYGLDMYSLWESLRAVTGYLHRHQPQHVEAALSAYRCFEPYGQDPQRYAYAALVPRSCQDEVVTMLGELRRAVPGTEHARARDAAFDAEQNALVAREAERYYRTMLSGGATGWNIRDRHMAATLDRLLTAHGEHAKAVVWEHNTHIGDARFTDMTDDGMVNLGQLARERYGEADCVLVGCAGHRGSVIAADAWGAPMRRLPVPPARPGTLEDRLHAALPDRAALLLMPPTEQQPGWLADPHDHRAIGVVYRPERERFGNYVPTVAGRRYDALLWYDETHALTPLHPVQVDRGEPETWPWAV